MAQHKLCENCPQAHECQEVYRHLGNVKGPSIAVKVIVAFLLPMLVFVVSLAIFDRIFTGPWGVRNLSQGLQTFLSFVLAVTTTLICIVIVKILEKIIRAFS